MKKPIALLALSIVFVACERKEDDKPSTNETSGSVTNDTSVIGEAPLKGCPSFKAWSKVSVGLTEAQVIEILGEPKRGSSWDDYKRFPNAENAQYNWSYGSLYPESELYPSLGTFDIAFSQGRVVRLNDPFGDEAIKIEGTPTTPRLFIPNDDSVFDHFPRVLDLRWWAASGSSPITYEVSVEVLYPSGEWGIEDGLQKEVDGLHVALSFPGANKGRWRVRARNEKGVGEWSDYRIFDFTR